MNKEMEHFSYENRLTELGLLHFELRRFRQMSECILSMHTNTLFGKMKVKEPDLVMFTDGMRYNEHKLKHMKFHPNTRKHIFFIVKLFREFVNSAFMESLHADTQNLFAHGSGQPHLADPA